MKLAVIGEPCVDYIHRETPAVTQHNNHLSESQPGWYETNKLLGGILYSVVSLAVIAKKEDEIYPVMNLGADEFNNITSFLSGFRNIRQDFIFKTSGYTRIVNLYYKLGSSETICGGNKKGSYDREESSSEPALPVSIEQIMPAAQIADGILVNMVSGIDIKLETLLALRKYFKGYMHMDLHNAVMQTGKDGHRTRSPLKDWLEWCTNCNTLQMNEAEISSLTDENLNEYQIAEKILGTGKVKYLVITKGTHGVTLYEKKNKISSGNTYADLDKIDIASIETNKFLDSTGCGDVFASAFFYKCMENNFDNVSANLHYANRMAGKKAKLMGAEELDKL